MRLDTRIVRSLDPENGGAATRAVLRGLARHHGYDEKEFDRTMRELLADRRIVMHGGKRGTVYAQPGTRRRRR